MKEEVVSPQVVPASVSFLNCAPGFWEAYRTRSGLPRRRKLLELFRKHPAARLPVNNKWQATTEDADLATLVKKGVLRRVRDGGSARHPLNKTSAKRQTYLVLVEPL